jgi:hypothetical protein
MAGANFQNTVFPPGMCVGQWNNSNQPITSSGMVLPHQMDQCGRLLVTEEHQKPTFRSGAAGQTFYSTAAAVLMEIVGSATKTVRIKKIVMWAQCATKFFTELQLLRSTSVSGSGAANVGAIGAHDLNDPAATAVINYYTAAATYGSGHTVMGARYMGIMAPAATNIAMPITWDFCVNNDKPLILRGAGDVIQIYNTILTLGSGTYGYEVEWEEDNS